jgi:hypothetical protein
LLNHFAQAGIGALPVPKMIAPALCAQFNLARVGDLTGCRDEFFVILTARTDVHPSLQLLVDLLARSARR